MKNKVIALFAALGILAATAAPANAWYRGGGYYGGYGYGNFNQYNYYGGGWNRGYYGGGNYGAALGVAAGAALLGGVLGGASNKEPLQTYKDQDRNIGIKIIKKKGKKNV